jgi:NAD(P)H-flavin reductase
LRLDSHHLPDYLHLTKRFGTVAIAQFPLQYGLSLKSFSPFSWLLNSSHEHINRYHQILARAITALLALHAAFYLNFFAQVGVLGKRLFDLDVTVGILAFGALLFMYLTSITAIRKYSYRLFFIVHLAAAFAIPGLILFHARAARPFVIEALVVFLIDLGVRRTRTMSIQASVEAIPGTDLVKITAALPRSRIAPFVNRPGAHVYLTIPRESRPTDAALGGLLYEFLLNPFTIAAVDELASQITLVARAPLKGQITQRLASLASSPHNTSVASIPLNIEGPYGAASRRIDEILGPAVNRILIVAGGVGATFAVPMYRAAIAENPNAKVELIWAVRTAGDATWALTPLAHDGESAPAWANILDDPNVRIFLTGDIIGDDPVDTSRLHRESSVASTSSDAGDVELNTVHRDRPSSRRGAPRLTSETNRKRPDLRRIVDATFRKSADDRVAVLVCGPHSMTREVRGHVSIWVDRGRDVVWHDESFGW